MTFTPLCFHGHLRRQCETCDLADDLDTANEQIAVLTLERDRLRAVLPLLRTRVESFLLCMENIIKGIHG